MTTAGGTFCFGVSRLMGPPTWYVPIRSWPGEPSCAAVAAGCRSLWPWEAAVGLRAAAAGGSPADPVALRFLRRLACAGTVAAGRARSASGEGRCTDPSKVRCTNSSPCDLPKPALAAFGMDSARTKTHGRATVACQKGGMYPTFDSAAGSGEMQLFSVSDHI